MPTSNRPIVDDSPTLWGTVHGAFEKLTRPPVLTWLALLQGIAVAWVGIAHLIEVVGPLSSDGSQVAVGDYLAFLTGGSILSQGHGDKLYDLSFQRQIQEVLAAIKLDDYWQPYMNPPLLAIGMRWLAPFPFPVGFRLFAITMLLTGVLGAWALTRLLSATVRNGWDTATIVALVLSFNPVAVTMFGGQNTVITLALLCGALWALQHGRSLLAGVLVGALSYKPQYLPFIGLLLVWTRSWHAVVAAATVGLVHYVAGAMFVSPRWPLEMVTFLSSIYEALSGGSNAGTHFSLLPFFSYAVGGLPGKILALVAIGAVAVALIWNAPRVRPGDRDFPLLWSIVLVAGMLASPYLVYYDFGILVLPVAVAIDAMMRRGNPPGFLLRIVIGLVYVGYPWLYASHLALGFQLLTLWTVALFGWLCWLSAGKHRPLSSTTSSLPR